jgi:hypothetical protein
LDLRALLRHRHQWVCLRVSYPLSASCKGRTHLTMQLPRMPMQEIYRTKKGASITTKVNG